MGGYREESGLARAQMLWQKPTEEKRRTSLSSLPRSTSQPVTAPEQTNGSQIAPHSLIELQRSHGNQFVQRIVNVARKAEGGEEVGADVEQSIQSARGGGQPLDRAVGAQMGQAFDADFSGVRVHTGSQADTLNQSLNARAFTTGSDVFFREGEYNPGSSGGRELLAHELTHVVQQNGEGVQRAQEDEALQTQCDCGRGGKVSRAIQAKLSVGKPGDIYEQEADQMAQAYSAWAQKTPTSDSSGSVRRQEPEKEKEEEMIQGKSKEGALARQAVEEEEEEMAQAKRRDVEVQRQSEKEEEEPLQMKSATGGILTRYLNRAL